MKDNKAKEKDMEMFKFYKILSCILCQCMNIFLLYLSVLMGLVLSGKLMIDKSISVFLVPLLTVLSLAEEILSSDVAVLESLKLFSQSGSAPMKGCLRELVSSCDDKSLGHVCK